MSCITNSNSESPLIPSNSNNNNKIIKKKSSFATAALRGLGCASSASSDAASPSANAADVRSSAEWQGKRSRRRRPKQKNKSSKDKERRDLNPAVVVATGSSDVWCAPRFSDDSIDCVVRHHSMMVGRGGRHDAERIHREIMMFQTRIMSGRMNVDDRYRDWRLDVDRMSYEELLELGDRIGYVNTGLREEEISCSIRKMKHPIRDASPLYFSTEMERKCSICQEEYEVNDDMGKLECGHSYHMHCIEQWLLRKNSCPVCKTAATKT